MNKEKDYSEYSVASEYQDGFNKGADLGFSDGKDKGFIDGFEAACKTFDIDYPVGITLPSGKEELVNNFPPSVHNHTGAWDDEDIEEIRDFNEPKGCDLKTLQPKEVCCDCIGKYHCDLSPYCVGEYETINILKVQSILDELKKVSGHIVEFKEAFDDRGEFGIAKDFKDLREELNPIFHNLYLLQEALNNEALYEYLERVRQVNAMNEEDYEFEDIEDIADNAYMQGHDDGFDSGYKKGYIARLEEEDLESDED